MTALKFKDGVVLVCDKRIISRLIILNPSKRCSKSTGTWVATSGLVADARQLVARARAEGTKSTESRTAPPSLWTSWSRKYVISSNRLPNTVVHGRLERPC